jgi:DHA2 family lincomycin resistance protein-like MFS transporter
MVPVTAFLIQSFELKKLYLGAIIILLSGTICAACSRTFSVLLISRMLQASGTGMMIPIMMNTILLIAPPKKLGSEMAIGACAIQLGPALGPTISGFVLQFFNWHVLFIMLIPLIILAMIFGHIYLVNISILKKPKIDILSIILSTVGVGGIIYGLSNLSGSGNVKIVTVITAVGIISLFVFGKRQLHLKEPMLEIRTFKFPLFSIGVILVMISMMAIFTMNVMLPIFLQGALKTTTLVAAIVLLPATLINGLVTLIGGKIYDKLGARLLIQVGFIIILLPLLILSRSTTNTSLIKIAVTYIIACVGVGSTLSPSQTSSLNQLPKEYYPHGVALLNTLQQLSAAIGSSLFIGIMSNSQQKALSNMASEQSAVAYGFNTAALALSGFVLIGFLLSFTLKLENKELSPSSNSNSSNIK